jgi:arylsulfatase A-like enzyme
MSDLDVTRRKFLGISGATVAGSALTHGATLDPAMAVSIPSATPVNRPNIVLFLPDELRADSLACLGNPVTKTPNFDRLASEGVKFRNCHVQFPVCGASRCSLVTGWPASIRGHRSLYYFLRPNEPNLFRYLKHAGYDVYWYGKNDMLAAQSFYDSVTEWSERGKVSADTAAVFPGSIPPTGITPGTYSFLYPPGGDRRKTHDYALLQSAIEFLERKQKDRPFCLFIAMLEPHPPYTAPDGFYDLYSPSQLPPLLPHGLPGRPDFHQGIREAYGLDKLDEVTFRKIRAVYYGQVSYADWLLGELMEALEKTGHVKDTALICLSDHGDYAGDYGLVEKWPSGLEDALTRVPVIARVPGGARAVDSQEVIELYDVMQTCLDLAGVEAQHTHFARSLMPQISGKPGDPDRAAFCEGGYNVYEPQCFEPSGSVGGPYAGKISLQNEHPEMISRSAMVRTRDAKLITRPNGQCELYSYQNDPQEKQNLYGDSSVAALQEKLQQRLLNWYINTTGVAPMEDKDQREMPPYYASRSAPPQDWQRTLLDK